MLEDLKLAATAVALVAAFGAGWYVEHLELVAAKASFETAWKTAENQRLAAERDAREDEQQHALTLSAQFEDQRQKLEASNADARRQLRNALQRPISCPGGQGIKLGDLVIPGDALASLRRAASADSVAPPGPGASQPDR